MKKLLYVCLAVAFIFTACSKDEDTPTPVTGCMDIEASNYNAAATVAGPCTYAGCTDSDATNYNAAATVDDGTCVYNIANAVWEATSLTLNGMNAMSPGIIFLHYFWSDGSYGWEEWDSSSFELLEWGGGPGIGFFSTTGGNTLIVNDGVDELFNGSVDVMIDNNNMTCRMSTIQGEFVMNLIRTTLSVNDWK